MWYIILVAIVFAYLRGTKEGMTMIEDDDPRCIQPLEFHLIYNGVRYHQWFSHYHKIGVVKELANALLAILLFAFYVLRLIDPVLFIPLVFFIIWDVYEYAYSQSRFYVWYNPHKEHIVWVDLISWHEGSVFMHAIRMIIITALIWRVMI